MYSGTTLYKYSGRITGAHQKIDRVARKRLTQLLKDNSVFPTSKSILQFEGKNGPDGIKTKSPAKDEPWHYFDPFDADDGQIIKLIQDHYDQLVKELQNGNRERTAFEAAWLAHALVDGLTPAHHYPYEAKLVELRGGEGIETRTTYRKKLIMPGKTATQMLGNNWKMWGAKGLFMTHMWFELGFAVLIKPLTFSDAGLTGKDIRELKRDGIAAVFQRQAREVAVLDMYDRYYKKGWTPGLAYDVRHKLGPIMVKTVTMAWYAALHDAGVIKKRKKK